MILSLRYIIQVTTHSHLNPTNMQNVTATIEFINSEIARIDDKLSHDYNGEVSATQRLVFQYALTKMQEIKALLTNPNT